MSSSHISIYHLFNFRLSFPIFLVLSILEFVILELGEFNTIGGLSRKGMAISIGLPPSFALGVEHSAFNRVHCCFARWEREPRAHFWWTFSLVALPLPYLCWAIPIFLPLPVLFFCAASLCESHCIPFLLLFSIGITSRTHCMRPGCHSSGRWLALGFCSHGSICIVGFKLWAICHFLGPDRRKRDLLERKISSF